MSHTALDEFARHVRVMTWPTDTSEDLDDVVAFRSMQNPERFKAVLQDPRYLEYCKEQDRQEEWQRRNGKGTVAPSEAVLRKLYEPLRKEFAEKITLFNRTNTHD